MRLVPVVLLVALVTPGCGAPPRKLGIAGASCTASADCEAELQCLQSVCAPAGELARIEAERQKAQRDLESRRDAELAALMAELKALQDEQKRLSDQKDAIKQQLNAVRDNTEREKLLAEKAALDAELAAHEAKKARKKKQPASDDPLSGL